MVRIMIWIIGLDIITYQVSQEMTGMANTNNYLFKIYKYKFWQMNLILIPNYHHYANAGR